MELEIVVEELAPQLLRYALGRTGDPSLAEARDREALLLVTAGDLGHWSSRQRR